MKSGARAIGRVGKICYINAIPFYHRLYAQDPAGVEYFESYPAKINQALHKGEIDIAPVSSLEYLNHQDEYLLLRDLIIGSRDFSGSVILFSKEKINGLNGAQIALSKQSLSSVTLLKILLKFKFKFENQYVGVNGSPEEILKKYPAALVIGDDALLYQPKEFVYKYDLSELWWNWTEKPFCFAVWAVRKEFARRHPEEVAHFYRELKQNVNRNLLDIETLIKESLQLSFLDVNFPKIFGYLFNLSYGFDASMQEGLELFYRLAHRLGASPKPQKIEFFEGN